MARVSTIQRVARVTRVTNVFNRRLLAAARAVQRHYPAYVSPGRQLPPHISIPSGPGVEGPSLRVGRGMPGRADCARYGQRVARHILRSTGRERVKGHSSYLRAVYAARREPLVEHADLIMESDVLVEAAHELFDAELVVPMTLYANVYLPGQVLDVHTDIPAFRGAELGQVPPWLAVAMHHSGQFERWRIPIATAVTYPFGGGRGGALTYHTPGHPPVSVRPDRNSAVVFDADTIFHQVDEVSGDHELLPLVANGAFLRPEGDTGWKLVSPGEDGHEVASFDGSQVRFSMSWKGYCFANDSDHQLWASHDDDLDLSHILPALRRHLDGTGATEAAGGIRTEAELINLIIDRLIPFPPPSISVF